MNIETNKEDREKWEEQMFTETGINVLKTYLYTLSKLYIEQSKYPFKMPLVFGIPIYKFSSYIDSKEELMGRIKLLAQIFGILEIKVKTKNAEKILKLNGD